jgi:hypothetical protein
MAQKLSQLSAEKVTATIEARLQRILKITVAYFGLVPVRGAGRHVGGPQP